MTKRCNKCGEEKVVSQDPSESEFGPSERSKTGTVVGWKSRCRRCRADDAKEAARRNPPRDRREINRRDWERIKSDPDLLARRRRANAERKRWQEPERKREAQRRYWKKLKGDPIRHARHLETRRIAHRLLEERRGRKVTKGPSTVVQGNNPWFYLPAKPLREWMAQFRMGDIEIGELTGVSERQIFRIRMESVSVQFDTADAIITGLDGAMSDVYDADELPEVMMRDGRRAA